LLVDGMDPAPLLDAGVLASRALLTAHAGTASEAAPVLRALLEITTAHGFVPMTLEALEQVAAITDDVSLAETLRASADGERRGDRGRCLTAAEGIVPTSVSSPSAEEAVGLALGWLARAASQVP
jgi:hypothetical protein